MIARRGEIRDKFVEGDAGGARGKELLRGSRVQWMEDACGPIGGGGAGQALCGFKEGSEGGYGEGIALGQRGENAAKLIADDVGSELEGFGASFETGDTAASTVGGGGGSGHGGVR